MSCARTLVHPHMPWRSGPPSIAVRAAALTRPPIRPCRRGRPVVDAVAANLSKASQARQDSLGVGVMGLYWQRRRVLGGGERDAVRLVGGQASFPLCDDLLASMDAVPVDAAAARLAGRYRRRFGPSHGTSPADALIAAAAKLRGAVLPTRNHRHFPMPDLRVLAPEEAATPADPEVPGA
jgi:hypothetical protein